MRGVSCDASSRPPTSWLPWPFTRGSFTVLGVASRHSGERAGLHLRLAVAAFSAWQFPIPAFRSSSILNVGEKGARESWRAGGLGANCGNTRTGLVMSSPHNMSVNADAQVRPAAPRPFLGRRLLSRYTA